MAWTKVIKHPSNGAEASYWEVISINYDHKSQLSMLQIAGWVDGQAYEDGLEPLIVKNWEIPSGLAPQLAAGAIAFITNFAKSQPEFEGSTDV